MGAILRRAGANFVDAAVLGPPPPRHVVPSDASEKTESVREPRTSLVVSGDGSAAEVMELFAQAVAHKLLRVSLAGERVGRASAVKMCHGAYIKGRQALMLNVAALAFAEGVDEALAKEWRALQPGLVEDVLGAAHAVPPKAWRFAGEMDEVCTAYGSRGLDTHLFTGAQAVFNQLAGYRGSKPGAVSLPEVVATMRGQSRPSSAASNTSSVSAVSSVDSRPPAIAVPRFVRPPSAQVAPSSPTPTAGGKPNDNDGTPAYTSQGEIGDDSIYAQDEEPPAPIYSNPKAPGPKVLCLHGWRTSRDILRYQCRNLSTNLCYAFVDATFPASGCVEFGMQPGRARSREQGWLFKKDLSCHTPLRFVPRPAAHNFHLLCHVQATAN